MSTLPTIFFAAQSEMTEILDAGARSLKQPGLDLLPVKREMLRLPHDHASLVLDACNLLFAAILSYEDAVWGSENARDALALVSARIEAGRARGVVEALFFGPTSQLLLTAMDRAPIAFYAMSEASPDLKILDRCTSKLNQKAIY
jgi:hypothetical protein